MSSSLAFGQQVSLLLFFTATFVAVLSATTSVQCRVRIPFRGSTDGGLHAMSKLTDDQKRAFIRDGYVLLPGFVEADFVEAALSFIDGRIAQSLLFGKPAKRAPQVTDLVFKTGLFEIAEDLLGEGNVAVRDNLGQIALNEPRKELIAKGKGLDTPHPRKKWHIDAGHGKYASLGSDFSILFGVALSDGQQVDESRGQFTVFPGSHFITHKALGEVIKKDPNGNVTRKFLDHETDIGEPQRALLAPGDAIVAHQRLAHAPGINLWTEVRKNIYFRIVHAMIDDILDGQVLSPTPWVGFEGLRHLLPSGAVDYTDHTVPAENAEKPLPKFMRGVVSNPRELSERELLLTEELKKTFVRDGYVVLPGVVSEKLINVALGFLDQAYEDDRHNINGAPKPGSKQPAPSFHKPIKRSEEILSLLYKSGLFGIAEQIAGEGNVTLKENVGQVSYILPSEIYIEEGKDVNEPHPKRKWQIDASRGKDAPLGSDFSFVIGVALSHGQNVDENRGQFTVWPGSHLLTHPAMGEAIATTQPGGVMRAFKSKKLDVGEPKRILLRPGDAVVAHQRLAYAPGINLSDVVRKNVYFRIVHAHFDELLETFAKSPTPWVGFDGLQNVLPKESVEWTRSSQMKKGIAMHRLMAASSAGAPCGTLKLTKDHKQAFVKEGYVVIPGAVPMDLVYKALNFLDAAFDKGRYDLKGKGGPGSDNPNPKFRKFISRSSEVKDLFFKSGLVDASEQLIGEGNVMVARDGMADVSFNGPSEIFIKEGKDVKEPHPKQRWKVDPPTGDYTAWGADYNFIVGVALSEGQNVDENRGQFTVWPGSHILTHRGLSEAIREVGEKPPKEIRPTFRSKKMDLGEPKRVLLKPGDVVIAHQRLAVAQGFNLSDEIRKNVYFRVAHTRFDSLVDDFVLEELPFTGFEGLQDVVAEVFQK